jgi:hypothetical protein
VTVLASSETRKKQVVGSLLYQRLGLDTKKAPWRGPEPGGVEKGVLSVRALVVGSVELS